MIEAVLFDFNGIIVDDESVQLEAYREALKPEAIELTDEHYYAALGMDDRSFVRAQFARAGKLMSEEAMLAVLERKAKTHREKLDAELPLFPGVVTFVKACARHYTTGLVSMARREDVEYVLERAGLRDSFDAIVCAEDVEAHKPDPTCYNLAFRLVDRARYSKNLNLLVP